MKRKSVLLVLAVLLVGALALLASCGGGGGGGKKKTVSVVWSNYSDTFLSNVRREMGRLFNTQGKFNYQEMDSNSDIPTEQNNINTFLARGSNYFALSSSNTNGAAQVVEQLENAKQTVTYINMDPMTPEMWANSKTWVIVSRADESGSIMAEHLIKYWKENQPGVDRNGNGMLDYLMLYGAMAHIDTRLRSEYSVQTLKDEGVPINSVQDGVIAEYNRATAQNMVQAIIAAKPGDVEAVIACNDDMALGAIEALKGAGFFVGDPPNLTNIIPVVGVDATMVGQEAVKNGYLLGTSLWNPFLLARTTYRWVNLMDEGLPITDDSIGFPGKVYVDPSQPRRIYIHYIKIGKDNLQDAAYEVAPTWEMPQPPKA